MYILERVCFVTVWVWHFVKRIVFCALVSCRKAIDSYLWRIPERVCIKERTHLVKYRSNIWHNLFNNEACQKALNLWNRKCSLAPTKLKTVRIIIWIDNKNGIVWRRFHRAVWVFRRKMFARVSRMGIFGNNIFDFLIFSRCNKETLICRTDLCQYGTQY